MNEVLKIRASLLKKTFFFGMILYVRDLPFEGEVPMNEAKPSFPTILWRGFYRGSVIAVLVLFVFFLITSISAAANQLTEQGINFLNFGVITGFSLVISYVGEIVAILPVAPIAKRLIHFFSLGLTFYLLILKTRAGETRISFYLVGLLLYVISYFICLGLSLLFRKIVGNTEESLPPQEKKTEYKSLFK